MSGITDQAIDLVAVDPDLVWRTRLLNAAAPHRGAEAGTLDAAEEKIGDRGAAVIMVGPSLSGDTIDELAALRDRRPDTLVVMVAPTLSVSLLQAAMRAGVFDVLPADVDEESLSRAIRAAVEELENGPEHLADVAEASRPGRLIVVSSAKDGEGATTLAVNLAAALAAYRPGQVALVEGDPRFGDVAMSLGLPPPAVGAGDGFDELATGRQSILEHIVDHPRTGLLVLVPPRSTAPVDQVDDEHVITVVSTVQSLVGTVVLDAPFRLVEVAHLLTYADDVLLVSDTDLTSLKNAMIARQIVGRQGMLDDRVRLVVNCGEAGRSPDVVAVERTVGIPVVGVLPTAEDSPVTDADGVPLVVADPSAPFSRAVVDLARALFDPGAPTAG